MSTLVRSMLIAFLLVPVTVSIGQDESTGNSRFVLTLNDGLISSLKSLGSLRSPTVDAAAQGQIAAIELRFVGVDGGNANEVPASTANGWQCVASSIKR